MHYVSVMKIRKIRELQLIYVRTLVIWALIPAHNDSCGPLIDMVCHDSNTLFHIHEWLLLTMHITRHNNTENTLLYAICTLFTSVSPVSTPIVGASQLYSAINPLLSRITI